jgi:hypothetical protein
VSRRRVWRRSKPSYRLVYLIVHTLFMREECSYDHSLAIKISASENRTPEHLRKDGFRLGKNQSEHPRRLVG